MNHLGRSSPIASVLDPTWPRVRLATRALWAKALLPRADAVVARSARRARLTALAVAAVLGIWVAGTAQAAIISGTYSFTAIGFENNPGFGGSGGLAGSFTFSFDNSADIDDSDALTVDSLTLDGVATALFGPIVFSYDASSDRLNIGGQQSGAIGVALGPGIYDFSLRFQPVSGPNGPEFFGVLIATGIGPATPSESIRKLSGSFTPSASNVPAPSTVALLGFGAIALGLTRRRSWVSLCGQGTKPLARYPLDLDRHAHG